MRLYRKMLALTSAPERRTRDYTLSNVWLTGVGYLMDCARSLNSIMQGELKRRKPLYEWKKKKSKKRSDREKRPRVAKHIATSGERSDRRAVELSLSVTKTPETAKLMTLIEFVRVSKFTERVYSVRIQRQKSTNRRPPTQCMHHWQQHTR